MVVSEQSAFTHLITEYIVLKNMDVCVIKKNKSVITIETRHIYKLSKKNHADCSETSDPYPYWTLKEIYEQTFPGWEVYWLRDTTIKRKNIFQEKKIKLEYSRWWTADNNFMSPIFSDYICDFVKNWTGNAAETVFDVNMLVIDEKNIICFSEDDVVLEILTKNNINVHVIEHPARGFWDAGFHCMSSDIRRTGGCEDYFSQREQNFERHYF